MENSIGSQRKINYASSIHAYLFGLVNHSGWFVSKKAMSILHSGQI